MKFLPLLLIFICLCGSGTAAESASFPLTDVIIAGVSLREYDAIVYPAAYSKEMVQDVQGMAQLIYDCCGVSLPVQNDVVPLPDRTIRLGGGQIEALQSAGPFSYSVFPQDQGLLMEGKDQWGDWCALDRFSQALKEAADQGGTWIFDAPLQRILPAEDTLNIAAWTIAAPHMKTEEQIAQISECGFRQIILSVPMGRQALHNLCKWMAKYELSGLWDDNYYNANTWNGKHRDYLNTSVTWGHILQDEPTSLYFHRLAARTQDYLALAPEKIPFVNLYPISVGADYLQAESYQDYVVRFLETVQPSYTSFDIYPLETSGRIMENYFVNLDVFSRACKAHQADFGVYIQSVSFNENKRTPTEAEMRWQAYNALAFGARGIQYFTYRTPTVSQEPFQDALIDRNNEKTERWYAAKRINQALNLMGSAYCQYRHLGTLGVNMQNAPAHFAFDSQEVDIAAIRNIHVSDDQSMLMGVFSAQEGTGNAFICVHAADPGADADPITVTMQLSDHRQATLYQGNAVLPLPADENGHISFTLVCGEGVFFTLE